MAENTTESSTSPNQNPPSAAPESADSSKTPLPLPAPEDASTNHQIDMSSGEGSIRMDHMGPLVVNQDGTLARISNWAQMTELEKKNTLRVLGKRNQLRRENLMEKMGEGEKKEG